MKHTLTLITALLLAPLRTLSADETPDPAVRAERPNIVYIIADDHAWPDFGFMGNERVHTPNLDRLAAQSARFTNGYVPSSVCRPSLVSLLTGLYPHQHGVHFNHGPPGSAGYNRMTSADVYVKTRQREFELIRGQKTLPGILQAEAGYRCLQTGKFWEGHWRNGGFTEGMTIFKAPPRSQTFGGIRKLASGEIVAHGNGDVGLQIGRVTMQPIYDFIDDCTASETPWFVWYAPYLPHQPHDSPKRFYDLARSRPGVKDHELPYFASIAQFDETVGQLIQYVGKQGQLKNTVLVFVSDNGWRPDRSPQRNRPEEFAHTARSKRAPFDDGLRTPILIRWDGVIAPATWESPVSSIDLMPTLLAIADVAENHRPRLPGVDLLPVCRGQLKPDDDRPIFGEIYPGDATSLGNPSADIAYRWIRQANLKLIEPHKQANGSGPWGGHLQSTALFDVKADPFEKRDLSSLAEHKQDVARLRTQLDRWWKPNELEISDLETRVVAKADGRWFGRATVERTAEGTLVLCYRGASKHTGGDGVIHVRFSSDGGQNWSEADHGLDGSPIAGFPISFDGDDAFEPYLYATPNGRIILHVWRTTGPNHREGKGTWQTDSVDGGQTWSKLRQVDFVGIENDDHCYATDDHTTIDGTIYTSLREYVGGEKRWRCRFIQSPDNGVSWRVVSEQVNVPEHNSVEKGFEYVGGDRIVSVGSDGPGRRFVLQTHSEDRGKTWQRWKDALPQAGVWDRPRIWTLAHLKGETEWWTGHTLIGVGNTTPKAGKKFPRANAVYLSTDRGESWKMLGGKPIDEFYPDGGYGDLEYDPATGWFVYLSYRGKGLHGNAEIVQYRFRLKDQTALGDFQHLVHSATWTEKWPDKSGGFEAHEVTAEIWTAAMQASLDETDSVHISARDLPYYIDGPLVLKSGQRLTADPKAEIRLKPGSNTCMVRNANLVGFKGGPVPDEIEPDTDIHIEGGIWTTLATAKNELNGNARGHSSQRNLVFGTHGVILFQNARRISVKNITVRKSKPFAIHLGNVHDFEIDGLTLEDHFRDGVHINGPASQGTIRNVRGNSHDDPVALNAWEWKNYAPSYGPIRDVLVENVTGASSGTSAIRLLPGVKRFDDGTELDCPLENITLRRITDIREFKIYDQPNLEMGRDNDFSIGVGSIRNLRFEELVFNRPGKIELHANTDGLVIQDVRINHPIADDWHLLAIGPKSMTWDRAKDPANWTEVFSPDLDCTVRKVTVSGVRLRDSQTDLPIDRVVKVIKLKLNPDYPKTTPKGGTGKGIWIR